MKSRRSGSFASALYLIAKALGTKVCGNLVGKSQALVYKWADPDLDHYPNIDQALRLDREFVRRGLGPPPILSAYSALLEANIKQNIPAASTASAISNMAMVMNICGELIREFSARQLGHGDENARHSAQTCNICVHLHRLRDLCASVELNVKSDTRVCPIRDKTKMQARCGLNA